jgi:hypothetical protein
MAKLPALLANLPENPLVHVNPNLGLEARFVLDFASHFHAPSFASGRRKNV